MVPPHRQKETKRSKHAYKTAVDLGSRCPVTLQFEKRRAAVGFLILGLAMAYICFSTMGIVWIAPRVLTPPNVHVGETPVRFETTDLLGLMTLISLGLAPIAYCKAPISLALAVAALLMLFWYLAVKVASAMGVQSNLHRQMFCVICGPIAYLLSAALPYVGFAWIVTMAEQDQRAIHLGLWLVLDAAVLVSIRWYALWLHREFSKAICEFSESRT